MGNPQPKPSFSRRVPKRVKRANFSTKVRNQIIERDGGCCRVCGVPANQIHHIMPKGAGRGRGVFTNGMLICNGCHLEIHANNELLTSWQHAFEEVYGPRYFKDEWDD